MKKSTILFLVIFILGYIGYKVYQMPKFKAGEDVPNFTTTLLNGEQFSLSDLKGNYVLLDFWGSWCGPCRKENKDLVSLYQKHKDKNFEIVSVAIETRKESAINAIKKDKLDWDKHIVLLDRFKSDIAKQFGVREIPTKYLIGPNGNILSVNESFLALDSFLSNNLN